MFKIKVFGTCFLNTFSNVLLDTTQDIMMRSSLFVVIVRRKVELYSESFKFGK